jgi:uncharacterized protein
VNDNNGIDKKLLDILVCPISKGPLKYNKEGNELISLEAGLAFPVEDGVPIMLLDRARKINN